MKDSTSKRTSRDAYAYFVSMPTRWMDNDIYGHVNNVVYYSYFDTTANRYLIDEGGLDIHAADTIAFVVSSSCEYYAPVAYPDELEVALRVAKLGSSSVTYELAVFRRGDDSAVATGSFTHVFVGRSSGKSTPIPEAIRAALQRAIMPV
ncbi:MAG: acyl-CoA thioesterase [Gammaproteobacteria bacterium]|nr:acyl-CoA thioesterase [Gammaproteobacteria bacterium]NND39581.1 acyl-CoA thioesterase [Pseudomonadales bacterium]NNL11121.1 acyl-CoA thioesterase [Pseudomonadales bacterium]NNM12584.1 acyl-CoA thioesterase [Pseudomonadales bacterium]RZV58226.1 MAG: acyl-CoA thioesterase [Pseudomonadales bacterium]